MWLARKNIPDAIDSRPKHLIECKHCSKIFDYKEYYSHKQALRRKKGISSKLKQANGEYNCPVANCSSREASSKEGLIDHLLGHASADLISAGIKPEVSTYQSLRLC